MSAFELPPEHVALLVHAGSRLRVGPLPSPNDEEAAPDLSIASGRRRAFELLWHHHLTALSEWCTGTAATGVPAMPSTMVPLRTEADLVQMLQWVRCFEYQTSGATDWPSSWARQYCALLTRAVIDALIDRHDLTWVHEPARQFHPLEQRSQPTMADSSERSITGIG